MLDTPEKLETFRDFAYGFGAWEHDEINAWSNEECEALFIQFVSGYMREGGITADMSEDYWKAYEARTSG